MKSHLSEYLAKTAHSHTRFIITRRNKPVAALVNIEDLNTAEQKEEEQGLLGAIGKWGHFDEISEELKDVPGIRKAGGKGKDVPV